MTERNAALDVRDETRCCQLGYVCMHVARQVGSTGGRAVLKVGQLGVIRTSPALVTTLMMLVVLHFCL